MARNPAAEEFYGAPTSVTQPVVANPRSPAEEAYLQNIQIQNRQQDRTAENIQRGADSNVAREKSFGDSMSKGIEGATQGYLQGREASERTAERRQQAEERGLSIGQKRREGERDVEYGDEMAKSVMEKEKANLASTRAGTESTVAQTQRAKELAPGELQAQNLQNKTMGENLAQAPLQRKQLSESIRSAGLQNDTLDQQNKAATIGAIISNARSQGRSPQEADQIAQQKVAELKSTGQYDDATIQKGNRLATTEGFQDSSMKSFILQSDPQFQQAQKLKERMTSSANIMASLKSELSKLEADKSLFDSPASKQAMDNIAAQLDASGQSKLANSLRESTLEAFMTPGSPTTKLERAKQAVLAVSQSIKNELGTAATMAGSNPHMSPQALQPIWQAVNYNPNQPLQAPNLFQGVGGPNIMNVGGQGPGVGGGNFITPPGMAIPPAQGQQPQQQAPAVDLFGLPGAQRKPMPVPPPKGR